MWRYHELLPVREKAHVQTLGEGMTPLVATSRLAPPGLEKDARLLVKDEGQNPTGSFKARGMAAAVSRALELGAGGLVTPTAGNAGAAMAAYAARAGLAAIVVTPEDAPQTCIQQARIYGADVVLVDGLISDAGYTAANMARERGWFNMATLRVPSAIGDRLILQAVLESGGTAICVSDEAMIHMVRFAAYREGMLIAVEAAATLAAYHRLLATHFLAPTDETVLFFTGSGLPDIGKYSL